MRRLPLLEPSFRRSQFPLRRRLCSFSKLLRRTGDDGTGNQSWARGFRNSGIGLVTRTVSVSAASRRGSARRRRPNRSRVIWRSSGRGCIQIRRCRSEFGMEHRGGRGEGAWPSRSTETSSALSLRDVQVKNLGEARTRCMRYQGVESNSVQEWALNTATTSRSSRSIS